MVMVFACTKESVIDKPITKHELTAYETHINKTLKDFKQKMEYVHANPHLKSGESIPADSAVWLLEATINFSHAFPNEFYSEFEIDSLTLVVERNADGTVDMNELTSKYDEMKQAVADAYHNSGYEVKGLAVVDLTETTVTVSEIIINVQVITGSRGVDPGPGGFGINGPFAEGDDWWYGEEAGNCDENGAEGSDAAEQLQNEIANEIPDPSGNYFFINITEYIVEGGDQLIRRPNDLEDNHIDYYLYYANSIIGLSSDTSCVEWPEMNLYYSLLKFLIFSYLPSNDPELYGKCIVEVMDIQGYSQWINNVIHQKHRLTAKFGIKVGVKDGEGPEEL
jgi:hypothetical protein